MQIEKIISGGQTGADQGALDAAIALGIEHGGWIPKDRKTEVGPLPSKYHLVEMASASYPKRTEKNVLDAHGTLILTHGRLSGGSSLTKKYAVQHGQPWLHVNLDQVPILETIEKVKNWVDENKIKVLNVAGSRESKRPGIHESTHRIILGVLEARYEFSADGRYQ